MTEQPENYKVPILMRIRRMTLRFAIRVVFRTLFRIEIEGWENVPKEGAYIVAYNHVSLYEPPLVISFWPTAVEALAGDDVFYRPGAGLIVQWYGCIPVKRGEYDRSVMDQMVNLLKLGEPLAMSPEGGRSHDLGMRQALAGVSYLVDVTQVPVIPVGVKGTYDDALRDAIRGKRPTLTMQIGKPFMLPPIAGKGKERRENRQKNADQIMIEIGKMLPPEYHGVYAGQVPTD